MPQFFSLDTLGIWLQSLFSCMVIIFFLEDIVPTSNLMSKTTNNMKFTPFLLFLEGRDLPRLIDVQSSYTKDADCPEDPFFLNISISCDFNSVIKNNPLCYQQAVYNNKIQNMAEELTKSVTVKRSAKKKSGYIVGEQDGCKFSNETNKKHLCSSD